MTNEERQQAIAWFENRISSTTMPGERKMFGMALLALRERQERDNPQPLTLDELREMDGETIYIPETEQYFAGHGIVNVKEEKVYQNNEDSGYYPFDEYGLWLAYRTRPKEAQP